MTYRRATKDSKMSPPKFSVGIQASPIEGFRLKVEHFDLKTTNDYPLADLLAAMGFDDADVEKQLESARQMIGELLETDLDAATHEINSMAMPKRVHAKPEGVELILVEDPEEDPALYLMASALGLCERPSALSRREVGCYQALYFPPRDSDPDVYMDTKDLLERIRGTGDDPDDLFGSGVIW
jgi:hypothetical protein